MVDVFEDFVFKIKGKDFVFNVCSLVMDDFIIRPMLFKDENSLYSLYDNTLSESIDTVIRLSKKGLFPLDESNGILNFVAIDKKTKKIVGRLYLKSWLIENMTKPKYLLVNDGIRVSNFKGYFDNAETILEMGGLYVDKNFHKREISKLLQYYVIDFVYKYLRDFDFKIDLLFILSVGMFRMVDNTYNHDFGLLLLRAFKNRGIIERVCFSELSKLIGINGFISQSVLFDIFENVIKDDESFFLGMPRKLTYPSYKTNLNIVNNRLNYKNEKLDIKLKFKKSNLIHAINGGTYFYAYLNEK